MTKKFNNKNKVKQEFTPFRFRLRENEERNIVFLDDKPATFREHEIFDKEKKRVLHFSCLKEVSDNCPFCKAGVPFYTANLLTIIDIKGWTDKKGEDHPNSKLLFCAKMGTMEQLMFRKKNHKKGLTLLKYAVVRRDQRSPVVGNDFEVIGKVKDADEVGGDIEPFDYAKMSEPISIAQAEKVLEGDVSWWVKDDNKNFDKKAKQPAKTEPSKPAPVVEEDEEEIPF